MSGEQLRAAIQALLNSHPGLSVSAKGHAPHAERYISASGRPIAFEPERKQFQNLWVRANNVAGAALSDIPSRYYDCGLFNESKPNHNLFGEPAFKDTDLICFKIENLWQAVRVIRAVAGEGVR